MAETAKKETAPSPKLFRVSITREMLVVALDPRDAEATALDNERDNDSEPHAHGVAVFRELHKDEKGSLAWISDDVKTLVGEREKIAGRYWEDFTVEEWLDGRAQAALKAAEPESDLPPPDHPGQSRMFPEASNG